MAAAKTDFQTIDEYIATFPDHVQAGLEEIRGAIKKAVPDAEEAISYQLPAFKHHGMLIYFSAYKEHYSLSFPPPFTVFVAFKDRLSPYEQSKTTVQLPMNAPLPLDLIGDLAAYRSNENAEKEKKKKKK